MRDHAAQVRQGVYTTPDLPFLGVRTTHASRLPYAPHLHDTLSLGLVFSGKTLLTCNGIRVELAAGDMALIAPEEVHSCNPIDGQPRGYHMFHIDAQWALTHLTASPDSVLKTTAPALRNNSAFASLLSLAEAIQEGRSDAKGVDALIQILVSHCRAIPQATNKLSAIRQSRELLRQTRADRPVAVAELAAMTGLGRETFIRSFRRATGTTPGSYRQCLRLAKALSLLRRGVDIAAAAADCGYADQSHLHRMCVKYLSATPAQMKPKTSLSFKK